MIPDTVITVVLVVSTFLMTALAFYLGINPVNTNDGISWWRRRSTWYVLIPFVAAAGLNLAATVAQNGRAASESGKAQGKLDAITGQLNDTKDKLSDAKLQLQRVNDDVDRVKNDVNSGRITLLDGFKLLTTNLKQTVSRPPNQEGLALVSIGAAGLAEEMQGIYDKGVKQFEDKAKDERFEIYRSMIQQGKPENVASSYLPIPPGPGYTHTHDEFANRLAKTTLLDHQVQIRYFFASAKQNVSPDFGTFVSSEVAAENACFPVIANSSGTNYLEPCISALRHIADITKPQ
jgi:hypothetical protein